MHQPTDFSNPNDNPQSRVPSGCRNPQSPSDPPPHSSSPQLSSPRSPLPAPRSSSRTGRPRKLDDIKRGEVCALVSAGCSIQDAARYIDCAASTIRREALRNPRFGEQLRKAFLAAELGPLNAIRQAAKKYWRAGAWLLERTNPQRFAKQNVLVIKPEHFREYLDLVQAILREEIDVPTRQRLGRRLVEMADLAEQEALAARQDPKWKPRRGRKPPTLPPDTGP